MVVDNKSDKVEAANAATVLTQKDKVNAVLGSWGSSLSMAGGPIFADAKIPAVAISATNPNVTIGNEYYFRVCFLDPFQGVVGANYAFKTLNAKKVAIIREVSNDYSVGLAKFFADEFVKLTGDAGAIGLLPYLAIVQGVLAALGEAAEFTGQGGLDRLAGAEVEEAAVLHDHFLAAFLARLLQPSW